MLQAAATADAEVDARRRRPLLRRRHDLRQLRDKALAARVERHGLDRLTRQAEGHEVAPAAVLGNAVPARSDLLDIEGDAGFVAHPSQLLAGRISPTSRPTTLRTGGCRMCSR